MPVEVITSCSLDQDWVSCEVSGDFIITEDTLEFITEDSNNIIIE